MSYGYTPYDKKSYKASKKRRKQAIMSERAGEASFYGRAKRRIIILIAVLLVLSLSVGAVLFSFNLLNSNSSTNEHNNKDDNSQLLRVVNIRSRLSKNYVPALDLYNGFKVNTLAIDCLSDFINSAKAQGVAIRIKSAYISFDEQEKLYKNELNKYLDNPDFTKVRAEAAARKNVPVAGCSEAQTGLLIDLDLKDELTLSFVERNCVNFGFVQRYPEDKAELTQHNPSKTIYRYVGKENAVKMRAFEMCLEEYNDYLSVQSGK